ncbi:hypothetical protein HO133_007824 [Letharia lupina]|uniref:DUF6590 domain-containing protein n=1 Tax=Letharia lupina TaxID=560253 RepID=A0A8H6FH99_9LECA|nr:uncharacterized protein HO133_007824 [Letharia lupina]KAF6228096.1 hypothetical protein HO133_007824 [Letharia lupina]
MSQNNTGRYPNSKIRRNNPVAIKSSIVVGTTSNVGKPPINVGMTRHGRPQPSNVGRKVCVPSNLGTINETSTDFRSTPPKSGGLDEGPDEEYWGDKCTSSSSAPQSGLHDQQDLANSMKRLAINSAPKAEPSESRWKGPRPSSVGSYWTERTQRAKVPPAMKIADNRDYHTFPKYEFKIGMIFRAPIHEEDYMGATAAACSAPSQLSIAASDMSTASGFAKNHQQMTDFGAVYSENRFMVVVVLGTDTYIALPFYTHAGTGTAYKQAKDEYVSVQDHREPEKCIRQGRVDVVRTLVLKEHVKTLHEFTTAHLGNPVSRKYRLPIAHQGRLTDEDTESLVSLFKTWIMEH